MVVEERKTGANKKKGGKNSKLKEENGPILCILEEIMRGRRTLEKESGRASALRRGRGEGP